MLKAAPKAFGEALLVVLRSWGYRGEGYLHALREDGSNNLSSFSTEIIG
jgi:hypothetical protein